MATVTGFEGLRHPRRNDLKQFAELFDPLFSASSDEARRQTAAALSQCPHVPQSVALQIGNAPISIAAIFLTRSTSISDATLLQIIRAQGPAHATAIARRENLSVHVVDALVERRQTGTAPAKQPAQDASKPTPPDMRLREPAAPDLDAARRMREDQLRAEIRSLARAAAPVSAQQPGPVVEPADALHEALLVRFARSREANLFAASLSAALSGSPELGERVLLDISGQQLAAALTALEMPLDDSLFILAAFYPDLAERHAGTTRGDMLLNSIDLLESRARVQSWLQAEQDEKSAAVHQPHLAPDRTADPRQTAARQDISARRHVDLRKTSAFGRGR